MCYLSRNLTIVGELTSGALVCCSVRALPASHRQHDGKEISGRTGDLIVENSNI